MLEIFGGEGIINPEEVQIIISELINDYNCVFKALNINVIKDHELLKINIRFLNHNFLTDIITFQNSENNIIDGELYISIDRVIENAINYNTTVKHELLRNITHGLLHICKENDYTDKEKESMRELENKYLKKLGFT